MSSLIKNLSIRNKMFFIFSVIIAVIIFTILTILPQIKNTILEDSKKEMINTTKLAAVMTESLYDNSIKNYLRGISETHLNTVQYFYTQYKNGNISEIEAINRCEKVLLYHKIGKSGYMTSVDISKGKDNISLAIHPKAKGKEISKFKFVQDMNKQKSGYMEFEWKNPKEKTSRLKVMSMSYFEAWQWIINAAPYKDELYSLMDIKDFRKSLERASLSKEKSKIFVVFDLKGDMIYHPTFSGKSSLGFQDKKTGRYFAQDIINKIKHNGIDKEYTNWTQFSFDSYGIESKLMYYIYLPKYEWVVSTIVNKNAILKTYDELLIKLMIIVSIMFIFMIAIGVTTAKYINNRINNLTIAAKELSENRYDFKLQKKSNDEIGTLEDAFDDAKDKIKNLIQNQKKLNENLKIRVKEEVEKNRNKDKQLFKSEKLASMGEMIGNIAHQWRQPLSVISTAATGMKMQKEFGSLSDELFHDNCTSINDNAQYLSKTIDDFTRFIKGDSKAIDFNLKNDTDSFLKLVDSSIKNYHLDVVLSLKEDINVHGYPNELIQCFINIFNNAKDALIENNQENDRYIFISQEIINNNIILRFKDNAGGVPDNIINKIFEPYFTTKHQSQGTGLGLHMTHNLIVSGMKGTIDVGNKTYQYQDKEYTGAEFTITLPRK